MVSVEAENIEVLSVNIRPRRDLHGDWIADMDEHAVRDAVLDLMPHVESEGFFQVRGRYVEEYEQGYEGDWDGWFLIEQPKVRFCGPLARRA